MRNSLGLPLCAACLVLLCACGSSSDESDTGVWTGETVDASGNSQSAVAAMQQDGYGFVYDAAGTYYVLPPIQDSRSYFGNMTQMLVPRARPVSVLPVQTFFLGGMGNSDALNMAYTYRNATSDYGSISLHRVASPDREPMLQPGRWQGYIMETLSRPQDTIELTLEPDGSYRAYSLDEGAWTGSIRQVDARTNLYSVSAGDLAGLGYLSSIDSLGQFGHAPGTYLYMGISRPSKGVYDISGHFLVLKLQ